MEAYILHVHTDGSGKGCTLCAHTLLVVEGDTPAGDGKGCTLHVHTAGGWKYCRYTPHVHAAGGVKGHTLHRMHTNTAGGGKEHILHVHRAGGVEA